jgi:hypothetical protein
MSGAWVAGDARARALLNRRVGVAGARELAACPTLTDALTRLAAGSYGRDVHAGHSLEQAQHAVRATLLWHTRVLVGWQPRDGARLVRLLAGWFEVANVSEHAHTLAGHAAAEPYRMGTMATVWPRLATTTSLAGLRAALTASPWGDPGGETSQAIANGMQLSWAVRVCAVAPELTAWAAGAVALLVARERFLAGQRFTEPFLTRATTLLGSAAPAATSLHDLVTRLPAAAAWALAGGDDPDRLWQAETRWWTRVERDAFEMLRRPGFGSAPVVGAVAVLAADAWRVGAALEIAARGGRPMEAFDALA